MDPGRDGMSDVFQRCRRFHDDAEYARKLGYATSPRMAEAVGLYPYLIPFEKSGGAEAIIHGRRLLMAGSNNYLGMTTHPYVQSAAADAVRRYGTGCTGSRFLNGTLELHLELEQRLARFVGKECALVFSTGYQTNLGVVSALLARGDVVVADREVHASLIDAIHLAKGKQAITAHYFRHNDPASLESILASSSEGAGRLVVVDGVYSTSGELAPLPRLVELCRRYGARLLVDDAHGLGVLGAGRGTAQELGCTDGVDLVVGTFSKSFASCGGFVAGPREVIHWIQHCGRSFMFSASLPPANAATVLAVLDLIEREPDLVVRVNATANRVRRELRVLGYDVGDSRAAIVPVLVGDAFRTAQAWRHFFDEGIYVNAVLPPAVPAWRSLLRTSYTSTHTESHVDELLGAFARLHERVKRLASSVRPRRRAAGRLTEEVHE
jgi:8-amino-7-oxononanoate synthase